MKNKILKVLGFCLALVAPAVTATRSYANVDQIQQAAGAIALSDTRVGGTVAGTGNNSATSTTTVIMNLSYSGPSTAAYITVASGGSGTGNDCIVFYAPYNVVDTNIGSATCGYTGGAFDLGVASVSTLGQLADLINTGALYNGLPRYHMTLIGGVRSDVASPLIPAVTEASAVNSLTAVGGYAVPTATATIMSLGIIPAQGRHVVLDYCVVLSTESTGANSTALQVFGVPAKFGAGVNQFGLALNDNYLAWTSAALPAIPAATIFPLSSPVALPWLEFANPGGAGGNAYSLKNAPVGGQQYNGHVVIRAGATSVGDAAQASGDYLTCSWMER